MKTKSKSEIAMAAGMSYKTFQRWMQFHLPRLRRMGVSPHQQLLPPKAVKYVCSELGIHEEDF